MQELTLKVAIGTENYQTVKTGIQIPKEGKYYIPDSYREPSKVDVVGYVVNQSVENVIRVMAVIDIGRSSINKIELEEISPKYLFKTKNEASDYYLKHKNEFDLSYLYQNEKE